MLHSSEICVPSRSIFIIINIYRQMRQAARAPILYHFESNMVQNSIINDNGEGVEFGVVAPGDTPWLHNETLGVVGGM